MSNISTQLIAKELNINIRQVENTVELLKSGATIPFIARYRKERTFNLDEDIIEKIFQLNQNYDELEKRKAYILEKLQSDEKLSDELRSKIESCYNSKDLEDIYLPFKSTRKTKAALAKENGLEPLAKIIMSQNHRDIEQLAYKYINDNIQNSEDALLGARQIIAEWINEDLWVRNLVRNEYERSSTIKTKVVKGKEEEAQKYQDYFDYEESAAKIPSHRFLAINRAVDQSLLKLSMELNHEFLLDKIKRRFVKSSNQCADQIELAIEDSYKRLLKPSLENELLAKLKEKSDEQAIEVFKKNLSQLLLASPLGQKRVLAIDPGFRTGCKVVCLSQNGDILHNETIYPHPPQNQHSQSSSKIFNLVEAYKIQAVAIGNGTAGRETESFVKRLKLKLPIFLISEDGASVYSASKIAREEFPNYDVTVRGAISIGRRLIDPLAELVKIDPKSIGVGQYQHEVNQSKLNQALETTIVSAVNRVGVNLNTAGKHILTYVSGLGPVLAQNIVDYRSENGNFKSRKELKKVPRLGDKAFEQAAGFLRITQAENPLDNSGIHPERYELVNRIAKDHKLSISDLISKKENIDRIDFNKYLDQDTNIQTLTDIKNELLKPGLDPRSILEELKFDEAIKSIKDLKIGMQLNGKVSNVTNFGAFVDLGIKENGLIHISNLANRFVSNPSEVVSLGQKVKVEVISLDIEKSRIGLKIIVE